MHAVGDVRDRDGRSVEARPQPAEHLAAHRTVQLGHSVGALREAQPHDGHVEDVRVAALVVLGAERRDPFGGDAGPGVVTAEVLQHEVTTEPVDARRDRRMGGEDRARPRRLQRLVEAEAVVLDQLANAFDAEEAGMALVGVKDLRRREAGQGAVGADGADAADAEQHLLLQAVLAAAAVQPVRHLALCRRVVLDVGVEQEQRHPADGHLPHLRDDAEAGHAHGHLDRNAALVAKLRDRKRVGVEQRVPLLLPAVPRQRLAEVAAPVKQADTENGDTEVARGLEVVAGEDSETAGVLRQYGGDAVFRGEVRDRARCVRAETLVPAVTAEIVVELVGGVLQPSQEPPVDRQRSEPIRRHLAQQPYRVVRHGFPNVGIDGGEQVGRLRMPRPAQVHGQLAEWLQRLGKVCSHGEATDGTHPARLAIPFESRVRTSRGHDRATF